jgi:hypothetical protein
MSNGRAQDVITTQEGRTQDADGRNWMRHREGTQAYAIDAMILQGDHTIEDIAQSLIEKNLCPGRQVPQVRGRVKMHIEHLQDGLTYFKPWQVPHRLRVRERKGKLSFE